MVLTPSMTTVDAIRDLFDATTLNTLWVDKGLKGHGLIQAFICTNCILNSVKTVILGDGVRRFCIMNQSLRLLVGDVARSATKGSWSESG